MIVVAKKVKPSIKSELEKKETESKKGRFHLVIGKKYLKGER